MGNIIDGKALSAAVKEEVKAQVPELEAQYGRKPCLVVIIVGENPASQVYVRNKVKAAAYTGMESRLVELPADISEEALLDHIKALNVDGFHPGNVANLWLGKDCIVPCTPAGVMRMLDSVGVDLKGKNAVVVGRSNIVGKPMAKLLLDRHATVTIAHSRTADLGAVCRTADVLVVAVGRAGLVTGDMVKPGAVVIDVGMNRNAEGKLCGDVDFASAEPVASWITPVPGGVGPMTIAMLMKNTIACFLSRQQA